MVDLVEKEESNNSECEKEKQLSINSLSTRRPWKIAWLLIILAFIILAGILSYRIARGFVLHGNSILTAKAASQRLNIHITEVEKQPEDQWYGQPPPRPVCQVREAEDYQQWRMSFNKAISELEKTGRNGAVNNLRSWIDKFEKDERLRAQSNFQLKTIPYISPVFESPGVRRLVSSPPLPAFERLYGYKIVLPWNNSVYYYEANAIPSNTPYLVHADGIKHNGIPIRTRKNIFKLLSKAGIQDPIARNVLIKASALEGGFEAVNTWDTGSVSVGFIQFTTGEAAEGHSLVAVMERMKRNEKAYTRRQPTHIDEYKQYFTNRGIDVRDGHLFVCDPFTKREVCGQEAVNLIIKDKRLIALFQDTGSKSQAFQIAQIQEAYNTYYLGNRKFNIPVAEVNVYVTDPQNVSVEETGKENTADQKLISKLLKKRYIYGEQAIIAERKFGNSKRAINDKNQGITRTVIRHPNLTAYYSAALTTETGRLALTDRAIQYGVKNACDAFEKAVNDVSSEHLLTVDDLKTHENEIISFIRNRIDIPAVKQAAVNTKKTSGTFEL